MGRTMQAHAFGGIKNMCIIIKVKIIMKSLLYIFSCVIALFLLLHSCAMDEENLVTQKPFTADDTYYENLRYYKKSNHPICFGWYAGYGNVGSPSMADHFTGLPDSMDIVSLWAGIPSGKAWEEMQFVRKEKGTRVVLCSFTHMADRDYPLTEEGMKEFAMYLVNKVREYDLDGLDLDYEPGGDWLKDDNFTKFIQFIGQYLGPKSNTGKLLIVDFTSNTYPKDGCGPYVDYFVHQMYGTGSANGIQLKYDEISNWCPPEKYIPAEWLGNYPDTGGVTFTEANGNRVDSWGNPLYSVIGMARWNPTQGRKGGFATYYFEYEYNTTRPANQSIGDKESKPIPYYSLRRGIQEQAPAIK